MDDNSIGYTKDQYFKISSKQGLPNRCPILRICSHAILTRFEIGFKMGGSKITFDEFLESEGQQWEEEKMIKEVETISWKYAHDVLKSVENVCPEVMLFEADYLPPNFRQSAFGTALYYKDTRRFEAEPKHYSECAEYSEYVFRSAKQNIKVRDTNNLPSQVPEKSLEDYLTSNIEDLEPGMKLVKRQKAIGNWSADIFASDIKGNDVLIELKSKNLNRDEIHKLTGQVSKYFNGLKKRLTT